jgi:predicted nuclease of predicted toxin-antitoxin system
MRLLFDQNLSHRLLGLLDDLFPGSLHVRLLGLAAADDLTIWNYARDHDLVIVTQDSDYSDWNKLRGAPPKIIWLRCGNASVDQIHSKLRNASERIKLLDDPVAKVEVVEVFR